MRRRARSGCPPLPQFDEAFVTDAQVVGDLMVERLTHTIHQPAWGSIATHQRSSEQRDLARDRDMVCTISGAWNALIQAQDIPPEEAMKEYIDLVNSKVKKLS